MLSKLCFVVDPYVYVGSTTVGAMVVAVNWCQGWFQYVPYPALNVLDCVRQLLTIHDSQLDNHYSQHHITGDIYIWSLLETAYYEVNICR